MRTAFHWICTGLFVLAVSACNSSSSSAGGGSLPTGTTTFTVSVPNAPNSYTINSQENPSLTLQRGQTYTFTLNTPGHPFYIMSVQGTSTSNAYTNGVSGNGGTSGSLTFAVPTNAPSTLFYDCSIHAAMTGQITVTN